MSWPGAFAARLAGMLDSGASRYEESSVWLRSLAENCAC
jgi:hypothetical protein